MAQFILPRTTVDDPAPHALIEDGMAITAETLCVIHRDVGVAEQFLGADVPRAQRYPDARADEQPVRVDVKRRAQRVVQPFRDSSGVRLADDIFEQERELVAADARHGVAWSAGAR